MFLFIGLCIIAIATGVSVAIIQWKMGGLRRRKKTSIGVFGLIMLPFLVLDGIDKGVSKMARPQNGRYGRRSIAKRKRKKSRF